MKNRTKVALVSAAAVFCLSQSYAQTPVGTGNPYLPLWEHLPDGEPRVFQDPDNPGQQRAYIIGSHDLRCDSYCGPDIRMWSAPVEDLTDWRDEGPIFTYKFGDKWDVMYAPDLVEVHRPDGKLEYYLYPHSRGWGREAMVCKSDRPDGPYVPLNLSADGSHTIEGSFLGFDPSIFVEVITDPADPDYDKGFRAYGYWGFQHSSAAELDQNTMWSERPGTKRIDPFVPASFHDGRLKEPEGTVYQALFADQDPREFNFFEASSIRQVGNKYVMIFSGHSGNEYGVGNSNSTLRYAYGDSPLGPWRAGGVLVDSRGVVLNEDGSKLECRNAAHNTHGSLQQINDQWYVFYHRPPRGFGFARQPMVAPVTITWDEKPVADGGKVVIKAYDPYADGNVWEAVASNGDAYTGAEVTSEGFQIYGLDPYKYYSAGYACYLSNVGAQKDSWDIWDNSMPVDMNGGDIVGYKYFGFGGLDKATKGLKPFDGSRKGDDTEFNIFLTPETDKAFAIEVWLDGPYANDTWNGKKIGEVKVPAGHKGKLGRYSANVSAAIDGLDKKHAIYLKAKGQGDLCELQGLGFSRNGETMQYPAAPQIAIFVDGQVVDMPKYPVRSNDQNGLVTYDQYLVEYAIANDNPVVTAIASDPSVQIEIAPAKDGVATVKATYQGVSKTYTVKLD